jgi:glycerol-3-phosphate acyltransferase PlsY
MPVVLEQLASPSTRMTSLLLGFISLLLGYMLGSIPTAYFTTRLATGKDIRILGGGNVGGLNTFREVGFWPAVVVAFVDLGKGAAAISIAYWIFELATPWVLVSGLASIIGHNWMLFLRFKGGRGLAPLFGSLAVLFPLHGFPEGLIILAVVILIPYLITRNVALSMGIGLVVLPVITWLGLQSPVGTVMAGLAGIIIAIKFIPTAQKAIKRSRTKRDFIFDRGRIS